MAEPIRDKPQVALFATCLVDLWRPSVGFDDGRRRASGPRGPEPRSHSPHWLARSFLRLRATTTLLCRRDLVRQCLSAIIPI